MLRTLLVFVGALLVVTTPYAQAPGDRPAGNIRGTRSAAVARNGMIATSQALASGAGLKVLQDGGNAIDAAITAAGVLAVVEPSMNGIGGDLLAIVYDAKTKKIYALDSTGRSAYAATPEEFAKRGLKQMPGSGPLAVDVPGVVEGWSQLLSRFGTISMSKALQPAIKYARDGFPVQEIVAGDWTDAAKRLSQDPAAARTFLPNGRAPKHGEIFANPRLASSLELIAEGGRDAFYKGPIARAIVADMRARNGLLDERDFTEHTADWVEPLSANYRGYDVLEMPPSTQGFVALEMLNILEGFDIKSLGHNTADYLHLVTEAKKISFADRAMYLADRDAMQKDAMKTLLSKDYAAMRRKEISMQKTGDYKAGSLGATTTSAGDVDFTGRDLGDTIYMTAADGNGNVVSLIQSLFGSFGAGIVAGETGITLHNRGSGFNLTANHPNQIGPHKRPLHTLVPAMIMKDGKPWVSFGVMGGDNQSQAHAQVVMNLIDFGMNIQEAGDAARMRHGGSELSLESGIGAEVRKALEARGHKPRDGRGAMGGYQAILIDPRTGVLMGGSDPRKDGLAIGW
ncbi:MAG TPA: gamma-glutamyltransferase [Vicinamibacterales bacterium]|nr:gamma-glutamyltransferase [Vicinamibacterales bacterium]